MGKKRKDGDGTLRQRKDGRWEGRIIIGYDGTNKAITKSVLAHSKRDCEAKLERLKVEYAARTDAVRRRIKPDMKLGDWLDIWYKTYKKPKIKPSTMEQYQTFIYKHIIPHIGHITLDSLTQNDIQTFLGQQKKNGRVLRTEVFGTGLSDMSVRKMGILISSALNQALKEKIIRKNIASGTKLPPKKAHEMKVLTHEEMRNVLLQAKEEGAYEILMLELSTGLRRGELCGLQWSDLNMTTGALRINRQVVRTENGLEEASLKSKDSERTIYIPESVLSVLKDWQKTIQSEWIFPSPWDLNKPRDPAALRNKIMRVLKHAGINNVRLHDLRHTFATTALEYGMDVKTLSMIIGHNSASTTLDIYGHITDDMQRKAAERIEAGIGSSESYEEFEAKLPEPEKKEKPAPFKPYKSKIRRSGTGGIYEINDHLYEGRYTPTNAQGKREAHNVYAKTYEECEQKLDAMIKEVKARIKADKERLKQQA